MTGRLPISKGGAVAPLSLERDLRHPPRVFHKIQNYLTYLTSPSFWAYGFPSLLNEPAQRGSLPKPNGISKLCLKLKGCPHARGIIECHIMDPVMEVRRLATLLKGPCSARHPNSFVVCKKLSIPCMLILKNCSFLSKFSFICRGLSSRTKIWLLEPRSSLIPPYNSSVAQLLLETLKPCFSQIDAGARKKSCMAY